MITTPDIPHENTSESLNEALLKAWLKLSTSVVNTRIVSEMSYNESLVCGILYQYSRSGCAITATELCHATKMLKSQMNRTLNQLEQKGMITRQRSDTDKRQVLITFDLNQSKQYEKQHQQILGHIDCIIDKLGREEARETIRLLSKVADIANEEFR